MIARWSIRAEQEALVSTLVRDGTPTLRARVEGGRSDALRLTLDLRRQIQDHLHGVGDLSQEALKARGRSLFAQVCPEPVRAALTECAGQTLMIETDGALAAVPWEFLYDGREYLALGYTLAREVPLLQTPPAPAAAPRKRLLIIADPAGDLEHAWLEGDRLLEQVTTGCAQLTGQVEFRSNDVSAAWVRERIWEAECVHYAGHLRPDAAEQHGPLAFVLGGGEELTLERIVASSGGRSLPAVMVLHACGPDAHAGTGGSAGGADALAGAGTHSGPDADAAAGGLAAVQALDRLAQTALAAGTRALIGVAVKLPDAPLNMQMMEAFYRGLFAGHTVGSALQRARQILREAYPDRMLSCAHILYGDPHYTLAPAAVNVEQQTPAEGDAPASDRPSATGAPAPFHFSQCRQSGCFTVLDPQRGADPFNAYCEKHPPSIAQKRNEARRLQGEGRLPAWWSREDVHRRVEAYVAMVSARVRTLAAGGPGGIELAGAGLEEYRLRVTGEPIWAPLARATALPTRLRLMGDARRAEEFPPEGTLEFEFELLCKGRLREGRLRGKRRAFRCRTVVCPDLEALLNDDLLWRPMGSADARRVAARLGFPALAGAHGRGPAAEVPSAASRSAELIETWATPLGVVDGGSALASIELCRPPVSGVPGPDAPVRGAAELGGDAVHAAALAALQGLLTAETEADLQERIGGELRHQADVELGDLADRLAVPPWWVVRAAGELACRGGATITRVEAGVVYVSRSV